VRPITLTLTLLAIATGCENSTNPFLFGIGGGGGGGAVTQAQVSGDWTFIVTRTTTLPCTVVALTDGSQLTAHLDVLADGTLNSSTSSWQNPPAGVVFPLSGAVSLTDGHTDLHLGGGSGSGAGMELIGTTSATGTFTGKLTDPEPGLTHMFSTDGCEYTTSGTKA
jgi:hypothetical protein